MTAITVRKLPEDAKQRLRMRAAANGRSMEAEARSILLGALTLLARHYGYEHAEVPLPRRRSRSTKSLRARPAT